MAPVAAAFVFAGSCVVVVVVSVVDIVVFGSGDAAEGTGAVTVVEGAAVAVFDAAHGQDVTVAISFAVFGTDIAVVAVDVIVAWAAADV